MKLNHPVGFAGAVYRPGMEADFEAAIAKAEEAKAVTPDLDALEEAGVLDQSGEPEVLADGETDAPKVAKGKKAAKGKK